MRKYSRSKVLELTEIAKIIDNNKKNGITTGLCHGCFDILHVGHLRHFEAAKLLCDFLVVTVTPDKFINKGPGRPVFPAEQRAELIAGISVVDYVGINHWESAVNLIQLLKPSKFIKGQEYENSPEKTNPNFFNECRVAEQYGGTIAFTYEWTSSSTEAISRAKKVII